MHLVAREAVGAEVLLRWLEPLMGMAVLTSHLMRRSRASVNADHCPQLFDAALAAAEAAFADFEDEEG